MQLGQMYDLTPTNVIGFGHFHGWWRHRVKVYSHSLGFSLCPLFAGICGQDLVLIVCVGVGVPFGILRRALSKVKSSLLPFLSFLFFRDLARCPDIPPQ